MALSVLSCAGVVSAQAPNASVQPQMVGPSTPPYYTVTAAPGNTYYFYPGQYDNWWTVLNKNPNTAVVQATANPNNGNLYAYESIKAPNGNTQATAVNGLNLYINPLPATVGTALTIAATTVTITVVEKAAFQVQVANPANAYGEVGMYSTYQYNGGTYRHYQSWYNTPSSGKFTTNQVMATPPYTINPGNPFVVGWNTGNYYQVAGCLTSASSGTTGSVSAQGQVQYIEIQFS